MANHEVLNNVDHKDLKIIVDRNASLGDSVGGAVVFPGEFLELHKEYPICFQKSKETGEFQVIALFGFSQDENLYLSDGKWNARYIPAIIRREPFLIGFNERDNSPMIHVDMDSPRISRDNDGVSVFLDSGGNAPLLQEVNQALKIVHEGFSEAKQMFAVFDSLELIEQFSLEIDFDDGSQFQSNSYYTLNQERISSLDDESAGNFLRSGYLQCAYMIIESMSNFQHLADSKNEMLSA